MSQGGSRWLVNCRASPTPSSARYPWTEWLDGNVWQLFKGEDFAAKPATIISNARGQAKRRGGSLRTRFASEDGRESVIMQFVRDQS